MLYDFHTHTVLSDGQLGTVELVRRAEANGYTVVGITDHTAAGDLEKILESVKKDCELLRGRWNITVIPGVEITHVPPETIDELAKRAKQLGAKIVVVHGETIVEPVLPGTNLAALQSSSVDILAHPGLLTQQEAELAAKKDIFLELSARAGHCLCNGRIAQLALAAGAKLLVDSDTHSPSDLLNKSHQMKVAKGAGLSDEESEKILQMNPRTLLERIG